MKKIILTKGLPASGKTTWAKQFIKDNPGYKRINKDDLRRMFDDGKWSPANEKMILAARDLLIGEALSKGYHVIVDDTNMSDKHETHLKELFKPNATVEIKDFREVPLVECLKRDQKRANYVGEKIIKQMYNQFLREKPPILKRDPGLPDAVMCDIDGTLALFDRSTESPYERDFSKDNVSSPVRTLLMLCFQAEKKIIITSGRSDKFKDETELWLKTSGVPYDLLYMRKQGDDRKDAVIKAEIFEQEIQGKYNIEFVFDDRKQIKELWVSKGLFVFDVNQTDEDF